MGVSRASSVGPWSTSEALSARCGKRIQPWVVRADSRPPNSMNSNNNILCSGAAEAASVELSPPLNETSRLMKSQRQVCGPATVRNTQPKVASGENNESTFQSGQISGQVAHVSADRVRQIDVAVKKDLSSG